VNTPNRDNLGKKIESASPRPPGSRHSKPQPSLGTKGEPCDAQSYDNRGTPRRPTRPSASLMQVHTAKPASRNPLGLVRTRTADQLCIAQRRPVLITRSNRTPLLLQQYPSCPASTAMRWTFASSESGALKGGTSKSLSLPTLLFPSALYRSSPLPLPSLGRGLNSSVR
jgi:hypothetical protein